MVSFIRFTTDINECLSEQQNCHSDANCTNIKGSHNCICKHGYQGNGYYCEGLYKIFCKFDFTTGYQFSPVLSVVIKEHVISTSAIAQYC